ncbi:MAG: diguanylate cyclase [Planctomycetes bacterium]|nr:diguanylate cyclase [Planctomycetota bacterium]
MSLKTARYRMMMLPAMVLLLGLAATLMAHHLAWRIHERGEYQRFVNLGDKIAEGIADRVNINAYGLRGANGVFVASVQVTRDEFARYVHSRDLTHEFPGAQGYGYIERVSRDKLDDYVDRVRREDMADFAVQTEGDAADLYVIRFIEPLSANAAALGHDIAAEPNRKETADRAMLTGRPSITGRILLPHDTRRHTGFLYLYPVYEPGASPATPEQRRRALLGWVYAPLIMDEMIRDVAKIVDHQIGFDIFDGNECTALTALSYRHLRPLDPAEAVDDRHYAASTFSRSVGIEVGGRTWTIWLNSTPEFDARANENMPLFAGVGGVTLSMLLAGIVLAQCRLEIKAHHLAMKMTRSLRESETESRRLATIASMTNDLVVLMDPKGAIEWVNDSFTKITGYHLEEIRGRTLGAVLNGPRTDHSTQARIDHAMTQKDGVSVTIIHYTKTGRAFWNAMEIQSCMDHQGKVFQIMAIGSDVTDQHMAAGRLRESEARFRAAIDGGFDAFFLLKAEREDGVTISDFVFLDINTKATEFALLPRERIIGRRLLELFPQPATNELFNQYVKVIETGNTYEVEVRELRGESEIWFQIQAVRVGDGVAVTSRDITDRKRSETALRQAAESDRLTGLPNRETFFKELKGSLQHAKRETKRQLAVLFLDFDRFKHINDTYGHDAGDELLCAIAGRMRTALRFNPRQKLSEVPAIAARFGGDEFVVLVRDIACEADAQTIVDRLLDKFKAPYALAGHQIRSSVSIGIATTFDGCREADALVRRADHAMYQAKSAGRGRSVTSTARNRAASDDASSPSDSDHFEGAGAGGIKPS